MSNQDNQAFHDLARTICGYIDATDDMEPFRDFLFSRGRLWRKSNQAEFILRGLATWFEITPSEDDRTTVRQGFESKMTKDQQKQFEEAFDVEIHARINQKAVIASARQPIPAEIPPAIPTNMSNLITSSTNNSRRSGSDAATGGCAQSLSTYDGGSQSQAYNGLQPTDSKSSIPSDKAAIMVVGNHHDCQMLQRNDHQTDFPRTQPSSISVKIAAFEGEIKAQAEDGPPSDVPKLPSDAQLHVAMTLGGEPVHPTGRSLQDAAGLQNTEEAKKRPASTPFDKPGGKRAKKSEE